MSADDEKGGAPRPADGAQSADGQQGLFETAEREEPLMLSLDGFEGPLHMLLELALKQKVDLRKIAMLPLAEQYLSFIREARRLRLDIAGDYLVTAAYLAYMKSRMLLPKIAEEDDEPSGEELAAHLAFQLERLHGMRRAADDIFGREQLGRDFFIRGEPEKRRIATRVEWIATQHDLLMAYSRQASKKSFQPLHLDRRAVIAIDEALVRLRKALGSQMEWEELYSYLAPEWRDADHARSAVASTFAATLELAKLGRVFLRQDEHFAPLMVMPREEGDRARAASTEEAAGDSAEDATAKRIEAARRTRRGSAA
ncbi:MAG: segregation/condensation protein A [Neomegalonema sp.]|nr:segregation/condensation protein A [Neomegalonema sp.]